RKTPVTLAIRPEFVLLSKSRHGGLAARIECVEFLGSEAILHCRLEAIGHGQRFRLVVGDIERRHAGAEMQVDDLAAG
ncbi:TOBE domain-containing protein, partial [Rhizobium ruizarguesonis]